MEHIDIVVVGAGVVGLSIASRLSRSDLTLFVIEKNDSFGQETSSRNSEVIHAGIYYQPDSLKAALCVEGKTRLYRYCHDRGIAHKRMGKLIVATADEQTGVLEKYHDYALANEVHDLSWLDTAGILAYEPEVWGIAALFSPSTGIIDSHAFMQALQGDLEAAGGRVVCKTPVSGVELTTAGFLVETGNEASYSVKSNYVINAAGLGAQGLATVTAGYDPGLIPQQQLIRGRYYSLGGRSPCSPLVYPVAGPDSLGIHVTLDLAGQARFGPDAERIGEIDYEFDDSGRERFAAAIRDALTKLGAITYFLSAAASTTGGR